MWGLDPSLLGSNVDAVIRIARSLFEPPNPLPPPTTFRYDTFDTLGAVAEPGSYAFLADPADTTSAVTTYEALRDGTTTALLIHKSDAHGASQAALYDAVEAGDLFEWREADDCFVRYKVTEVKPDPAGAVPRKLLAVEWMTYAFTGCSGAVATDRTAVSIKAGPLPNLDGTGITAPVVHGVYQIVPKGWTGATKAREDSEWSEPYPELIRTTDLAVARQMRHWREPAVPAGWVFEEAEGGGYDFQPIDGYCATWRIIPSYGHTFEVCATKGQRIWFGVGEGVWSNGTIFETRVVAGRPAALVYTGDGIKLRVHDRKRMLSTRSAEVASARPSSTWTSRRRSRPPSQSPKACSRRHPRPFRPYPPPGRVHPLPSAGRQCLPTSLMSSWERRLTTRVS